MDTWTSGLMDGLIAWMGRWMHGWVNGWMDEKANGLWEEKRLYGEELDSRFTLRYTTKHACTLKGWPLAQMWEFCFHLALGKPDKA